MNVRKHLVIGEDNRQMELATLLGTEARTEYCAEVEGVDVIIIPFGKPSAKLEELLISNVGNGAIIFGGIVSSEFKSKVKFISVTGLQEFQEENAIPTAEGTILLALHEGKVLKASRCAVLGYGNCGSRIVSLLLGFGSSIDIYDKNFTNNFSVLEGQVRSIGFGELTKNLADYDFVFNTIPEQIFKSEDIAKIEGAIINIASDDAGFPKDRRFANIPALFFPKESAKIIKKIIDEIMEGEEKNV